MAIGSSLGITLPTQGGNTGTWGTDLNTELNKIITAVEAQVPITALDFSADISAADNGITDLSHVSFDDQSAVTDLRGMYTKSGELYYRSGANEEIQMTATGALNIASTGSLGDSGGDYGTNGIVFDWDGTIYNAKNGAGADAYANVRMDELQLRDGSGNDLTIDVPSMASNYTLSMPVAVPATAGTLVQSDTSGNLTFSNTGLDDITLTTGQHVTVVGTGELKHGARVLQLGGPDWVGQSTGFNYNASGLCLNGVNTQPNFCNIPLTTGDRITNVNVYASQSAAGTMTLTLHTVNDAGTLSAAIATDTDTSTPGIASLTLASLTTTLANGNSYMLKLTCSGAGAVTTGNTYITYDRP